MAYWGTSPASGLAGADLNGQSLVLDPAGNTSITADTNNQIDIAIASADDFQFTANTFTALSGSTVAIASGATIANSGTATGFGKLVQIKSMSTTTQTSTTGTTYVATGLTLAFAQVTAGNYIHISATGPGGMGTSSGTTQARCHWALFKDAGEIAKTSANIIQEHSPAGDWADGGWNVTVPWYGSTGDTTSYTYTLQIKMQASGTDTTGYFGYSMSGASTSTITIMEFAA